MVGVPTLDLIAYPLRHTSRTVVSVVDARRDEVFFACYRPVPGGVQRITDYEVTTPDGPRRRARGRRRGRAPRGRRGGPRTRRSSGRSTGWSWPGPVPAPPSAGALVELATARYEREEFSPPADVHPLYLRRSDAEIEWDSEGDGVAVATARDPEPLAVHIVRDASAPPAVRAQHRDPGLPAAVDDVAVPERARAARDPGVLRGQGRAGRRRLRGPDGHGRRGPRDDDRGRPGLAPPPDRHAAVARGQPRGDRP